MNDNGSIISDGTHELLVYEVIITSFPGVGSHVIPVDRGQEMDRPCRLLQPTPQSRGDDTELRVCHHEREEDIEGRVKPRPGRPQRQGDRYHINPHLLHQAHPEKSVVCRGVKVTFSSLSPSLCQLSCCYS